MPSSRESSVTIFDGSTLAVRRWGSPDARLKVIALHGYMDNGETWTPAMERLFGHLGCHDDMEVCCMDFMGHGLSSHRPGNCTYSRPSDAMDVIALADALHWKEFCLMGHSMGSGVATLVASIIPHRVSGLVSVDGFGPWLDDNIAKQTAVQWIQTTVRHRESLFHRKRRVYSSIADAVKKYQKKNRITTQSATLLLTRGMDEVEVADEESAAVSTEHGGEAEQALRMSSSKKGYCFRHDVRLTGFSAWRLTEQQIREGIKRIACPVLLLVATNEQRRSPIYTNSSFVRRLRERAELVEKLKFVEVEGEHHLHMDSVVEVAAHFHSFFQLLLDAPTKAAL